jgi:hypothetical protein
MNMQTFQRSKGMSPMTFSVVAVVLAATFLDSLATQRHQTSHARSRDSASFPVAIANLFGKVSGQQSSPSQQRIVSQYNNLPLAFEPNLGQYSGEADFLARGSAFGILLSADRLTMFPRDSRVSIRLLGARNVGAAPLEELPGKSNYISETDARAWIINVPHYSGIRYKNVYSGIDLVYYGRQQQLESDFVVSPGADPTAIRFAVEGNPRLELNVNGDLILHLATGKTLTLHKPRCYQIIDGVQAEISGRIRLVGSDHFALQVSAYDSARPLIIDPVLSYSTFMGGTSYDQVNSIAVDSSGNAYVVGQTMSLDFPTVTGDFQPSSPVGVSCVALLGNEAFVTKLDSKGSALVYSTYMGGSGCAIGTGIAIDSLGNAFITGSAGPGFPTTAQAFQQNYAGPGNTSIGDAFVAKLNPTGTALTYSTYVGGSSGDIANGIALDPQGDAYIVGQTYSSDFPTSPAAICSDTSNSADFVTKLTADGSKLVYSTCLGKPDIGYGITVDHVGNAYVTGLGNAGKSTSSIGNCIGVAGGYLAKLNPDGTTAFVDCFPGTGVAVAADPNGNTYLTGYTSSTNFPTTPGAFQMTCNATCAVGGFPDVFLMKLNPAGNSILYATYLGGSGTDTASAIAIDSAGNAYVTGSTLSSDFPVASPIQSSFGGGADTGDAFVAELNPNGSALLFSTFLGGPLDEAGMAISLDTSGSIYVAGSTASSNFPTTPAAFQTVFKGPAGVPGDGFVAKFTPPVTLSPNSSDFGDVLIGTTSGSQPVTLENNDGRSPLSILGISTNGAFSQTDDCGSSLAPVTTCTVNLSFSPTLVGQRAGNLVISDTAPGAPQTVTLTGNGTDFSILAANGGSTSASISAGQTATYNLEVTPVSGFSGSVALTCVGAPSQATCSVPTGVSVSGGAPALFQVTVSTTVRAQATSRATKGFLPSVPRWPFNFTIFIAIFAFSTLVFARRTRSCAVVGITLCLVLELTACGGNGPRTAGTPAGNYTLSVKGTQQGISRTLSLTLAVN